MGCRYIVAVAVMRLREFGTMFGRRFSSRSLTTRFSTIPTLVYLIIYCMYICMFHSMHRVTIERWTTLSSAFVLLFFCKTLFIHNLYIVMIIYKINIIN